MLEKFKALLLGFLHGPLRRAIIPLLVITGVVLGIERVGWFEHLQASTVDALARGVPRKVSGDVVIVEITDADYEEFFGAVSPLKPAVVVKLIESVKQLDPAVIGVDLDTQDPTWACADLKPINDLKPSIVWAEVAEEASLPKPGLPTSLRLTPVLGGSIPHPPLAITRFPEDIDGVVRKYVDSFPVVDGLPIYAKNPQCESKAGTGVPYPPRPDSKENMPRVVQGMQRALAKLGWEAKHAPQSTAPKSLQTIVDRPEYLRFAGDRYDFQIIKAGALLTWGSEDRKKGLPQVRHIDLSDPRSASLKKNIVLIGGSFRAARDEYMTPLGKMAGVELIAHAVETEFLGPLPETPFLALILDLFFGSIIVFIYYLLRWRPFLALGISVAVALILPLFVSVYLFYNVQWFLNFVPVMFGMIVHQMYEGSKLTVETREELTASEKRNAALNARLYEAQTGIETRDAENQILRTENLALNAMLLDTRSKMESRDAENQILRKENAELANDGEELRTHIRRLGGHVRAKGQHAG